MVLPRDCKYENDAELSWHQDRDEAPDQEAKHLPISIEDEFVIPASVRLGGIMVSHAYGLLPRH